VVLKLAPSVNARFLVLVIAPYASGKKIFYATADEADAYMIFCFFSVRHNDETTVLGNAWTDFHENLTKRQRGKWSFQRHTEMGARPPNNFLGLKTDIVRTGTAWRFSAGLKADKSYILVSLPGEWLRINSERVIYMAVALKRHEWVNAFNLVGAEIKHKDGRH